jgi:hypothetical protein
MNTVKIFYENKRYYSRNASNSAMAILGEFLAGDFACRENNLFRDWALADKRDTTDEFTYTIGGNATFLEEGEDGYIYIYDGTVRLAEAYQSEHLKVSRDQLVKLFDDWQEKVCKRRPKEVIITYDNDQFNIETKD